jgi:hypothetical protein
MEDVSWNKSTSINELQLCTYFCVFFIGAATLCGSWPPPWSRWRFHDSRFFRDGVVSPMPNPPNLEDPGLQIFWLLPIDLSDMGGPSRSLRSHLHNSPGHWGAQISSQRKTVVLEVDLFIYLFMIYLTTLSVSLIMYRHSTGLQLTINCKTCEKKRSWPNLVYYPGIFRSTPE